MHVMQPNGKTTEVLTQNPEGFSLDELQELVGGYIELIYLDTPVRFNDGSQTSQDYEMLIVNEDGKCLDLPYNFTATRLWEIGTNKPQSGDVLRGAVLFVTREESQ